MVMFTFTLFDRQYPFLANSVQNMEILRLTRMYAEFNGDVLFYCFRPEISFQGKFGPKNGNCKCKLKFGRYNPGYNILEGCNILVQVRVATGKTKVDI